MQIIYSGTIENFPQADSISPSFATLSNKLIVQRSRKPLITIRLPLFCNLTVAPSSLDGFTSKRLGLCSAVASLPCPLIEIDKESRNENNLIWCRTNFALSLVSCSFMHRDATAHYWLRMSISKFESFICRKSLFASLVSRSVSVSRGRVIRRSHRMTQWV